MKNFFLGMLLIFVVAMVFPTFADTGPPVAGTELMITKADFVAVATTPLLAIAAVSPASEAVVTYIMQPAYLSNDTKVMKPDVSLYEPPPISNLRKGANYITDETISNDLRELTILALRFY